jgi:hypothetical protein
MSPHVYYLAVSSPKFLGEGIVPLPYAAFRLDALFPRKPSLRLMEKQLASFYGSSVHDEGLSEARRSNPKNNYRMQKHVYKALTSVQLTPNHMCRAHSSSTGSFRLGTRLEPWTLDRKTVRTSSPGSAQESVITRLQDYVSNYRKRKFN